MFQWESIYFISSDDDAQGSQINIYLHNYIQLHIITAGNKRYIVCTSTSQNSILHGLRFFDEVPQFWNQFLGVAFQKCKFQVFLEICLHLD